MKKFLIGAVAAAAIVLAPFAAGCGGTAEVTFALAEDGNSYFVSGVSGNKRALGSYDVPAVYDDGVNGEKPVTAIGDSAFYMCAELREITVPDSVTEIGNLAFALCSFGSFTIPDSVKSIGDGAFGMCQSLVEITVPATVESLGDKAFMGCSNLEKAVVKANVDELGYRVFYNSYNTSTGQLLTNTSLKTVYLPATLTKIHETALDGNFIEDIYFAGSAEQWNEVYFYKTVKDEATGEEKEERIEKSEIIPKITVIHCNAEF